MKFPMLLTVTAITLGTAAVATPALRLPAQMQQQAAGTGQSSTETAQGFVEQDVVNAGWLRLISGDHDDEDDDDDDDCEDDDRDDDDCDDYNRNGKAAAPKGPSTPPQNGLFNTGKAPVVESN
jgi:hypothetical protein